MEIGSGLCLAHGEEWHIFSVVIVDQPLLAAISGTLQILLNHLVHWLSYSAHPVHNKLCQFHSCPDVRLD